MENNKGKIFRKGSKQSGITLVALVVTIVVLLILAGISINLILQNNGIVAKAEEGREKYGQAKENEQTDLDNGALWIEENFGENKKEYEGLTITSGTSGVVFLKSDGITVGDINNIETGDIVRYGDYEYHYNQRYFSNRYASGWNDDETLEGWGVMRYGESKAEPGELCGTIFEKKVKSLDWLFGCGGLANSVLKKAPKIPNGVISLMSTFYGCLVMESVGSIPRSVEDMSGALAGCSDLQGTIVINANPQNYENWITNNKNQIIITGSSNMLNELAERL